MLAYGYLPNLNKNSEILAEGGGVTDFWLKLLLSDYEDDAEYSTKRESFLFHELFVWAPRFIDGVEVVLPGSGDLLYLFCIYCFRSIFVWGLNCNAYLPSCRRKKLHLNYINISIDRNVVNMILCSLLTNHTNNSINTNFKTKAHG